MSDAKSVYDHIIDLLRSEPVKSNRLLTALVLRLKLFYEINEKFVKDNCLTFAASLAYTTLLAMAPLTAISLSIFTSFEMAQENVLGFVFSHLLPNEKLAKVIEENIDAFAANAASVSIWGVLFLAIFAWWVLSTIEASFNMIWKVERSRPIVSQFITYWSAVTFAPILIALSIYTTAKLSAIILSPEWAEYGYVQSFALKTIPFLLTWIAFFLIYTLMPYARVYVGPALIGAVFAGSLFEFAKLGFNYYLTNFATYTAVYGALATIPIFLFWLYVTWMIVLLGSVIAYAIQYPKEIESTTSREGFDRREYLGYYAIRVLVEATRSFEMGRGAVVAKEVESKLEITDEFYETILDHLKQIDLIEMVETTKDSFMLKRPPEMIDVTDTLLKLGGNLLKTAPAPVDADQELFVDLFSKIHKQVKTGADHLTLLTLSELSVTTGDPAPLQKEPDNQLKSVDISDV